MKYLLHHTAISVRDLDKSVKFYEKLGFEQVHRYDEPDGSMSIVHMRLGDSYIEIFRYKSNHSKSPVNYERANNLEDIGVKHIALKSEGNIEAALADLKSRGLADPDTTITVGRTEVKYFFIQDPDGVWVEIVEDNRY